MTPIKPETATREWHHIDAEGKILGRLATEVATLLRGKHKVEFRRHTDVGDIVVITNAAKIMLTGRKETDKLYRHHTGWPRGLRETSVAKIRAVHPEQLLISAITGMLPKTRQRDQWLKRLKVYPGAEHPHQANVEGSKNQESRSKED